MYYWKVFQKIRDSVKNCFSEPENDENQPEKTNQVEEMKQKEEESEGESEIESEDEDDYVL